MVEKSSAWVPPPGARYRNARIPQSGKPINFASGLSLTRFKEPSGPNLRQSLPARSCGAVALRREDRRPMARLLHDESLLIARHWYSKGSSAATYWTLIGPRFSGERVKTVATPEEVELGKRLESIFSPHAVSQMQEFFKKQPDQTQARFVHYTSAEAALRIIGSKRIWMRNVTCMSDYSEVQHGFRILNNIFSEPSKRKIFDEALDACAPGAAAEAIKLFNSWWADISLNTYITSISEHDEKEDRHGRLSMWRAFGGNVARVAIVFKVSSSLLNAGVFNLIV